MPTAKKRIAKKLDPKKLFVIMTVDRETIAEMLNAALENTDGSMDHVNHFSEDDPRLTDEVCQDIANSLYDAIGNVDENDYAERDVYASALEQFS